MVDEKSLKDGNVLAADVRLFALEDGLWAILGDGLISDVETSFC